MSLIFSILMPITYIFIWIITIFLMRINFKSATSTDYSFKRYFSFESHNFKNGSLTNTYRVFFIISSIIGIAPFIYCYIFFDSFRILDIYLIVSGILFAISITFKILLFFTKTVNLKLFINVYTIRLLSLIASITLLIFGIIFTFERPGTVFNDSMWVLYLYLFLFIFVLIIPISSFFNSKFYKWYYLEIDENGVYNRPKVLYLALYEWLYNVSEILFVIIISTFIYFIR